MISHPANIIFFFLLCIVAPTQPLNCQDPKGVGVTNESPNITSGKTYGLVIGISRYESFPSLNYADRDAAAFYNFLRSKATGGIDSADIYYKSNDAAKSLDIWNGVRWLERRVKAGENAIIYFSGHGDAASASLAYLLAYDAPNEGDPIVYNSGGTCAIYALKEHIKDLVSKGVKVILITDACRTNDLPGKEMGTRWTFESITEAKCGEIQMISCSGNERSLEDKKWGNGRGVFSFHLLNGLMGEADSDPQDGQVTLYELERYVKDKVRKDTRSSPNNQPTQNPVFCCTEKNDVVLSNVDPPKKKSGGNAYTLKKIDLLRVDATVRNNILMALETDTSNVGIPSTFEKTYLFRDSVFDNIYKLFSQAISKKELIEPKGRSATDYFNRLLPLVKDPLMKADLQDQLAGSLINEAQTRITRYTRPPIQDTLDNLNSAFFNEGASLLREALKYTSDNKTLTKEIRARKLVLEARALAETGGNNSIALSKIDSSLTLMNTSYGFHTKGLLLSEAHKDYEALQYYEKAIGPNKKWIYPMIAQADVFRSQRKFDSAIVYYKRALNINPVNDNNVFKLGVAFQEKGQYDSSIAYLQTALTIRNKTFKEQNLNSANCINYLAKAYDKKGDNSTAESLYKKAISICEKIPGNEHVYYANALNNLAGLYDKTGNSAAAKPLYARAAMIKKETPPRRVDENKDNGPKPTVKHGAAIEPDGMANLLMGVSSGKNNASDFADYLCDNLNIMVKFNDKTMTFVTMCNVLKEFRNGKEIKKPEVKLIKDRETNCITSMDVTAKKGIFRALAKPLIRGLVESDENNKVDPAITENPPTNPKNPTSNNPKDSPSTNPKDSPSKNPNNPSSTNPNNPTSTKPNNPTSTKPKDLQSTKYKERARTDTTH